MEGSAVLELKKVLFDAYDGFSDKRIKNLEKGDTFIVDDRESSDVGADRRLYLWFCRVFVTVLNEGEIRITFRGQLPMSEAVQDWLDWHLAIKEETRPYSWYVNLKRGEQFTLRDLAREIISIVSSGERYDENAYKFVCPRLEETLLKLLSVLDRVWL